MAERKLSRDDTDLMREYIQEGIDCGETVEQIKMRRKELAELFNCTPHQVYGAVAWKNRKEGNLVLEKLIINSEEQPINANNNTTTPIATNTEVEVSSKIEMDTGKNSKLPIISSENEEGLDSNIVIHPKSGAWADYENSEIKEAWRRVEASFIDRNCNKNPVVREKMRILCTPGIKCYLEVRHILSLGFKSENIVAVEREKKAWKDFESNAKELGITPIFGELQDVLTQTRALFDVVLIDFVNAGSGKNLITLESLPLASKAIVSINVMAKREDQEFQETMGRLHKTAVGSQIQIGKNKLNEKLQELKQNIGKQKGLSENEFNSEICKIMNESRDVQEDFLSNNNDMSWDERSTMLWYMQRYAGTLREESWMAPNMIKGIELNPERIVNSDSLDKTPKAKQHIMGISAEYKEFVRYFEMWATIMLSKINDKRLFHVQKMADLLNCVTFGRRQITSLEKYKYKSKIGKTLSPFYTSFAVTELPKESYRKYQPLVHFALNYVKRQGNHVENAPPSINPQANRFTVTENGKTITSIEGNTLLNLLADYFDTFIKRYPLSLWEKQNEIPWKNLEDIKEVSN